MVSKKRFFLGVIPPIASKLQAFAPTRELSRPKNRQQAQRYFFHVLNDQTKQNQSQRDRP